MGRVFDARYRRIVAAEWREYQKPVEIDLDPAQVDPSGILIFPDRVHESRGVTYAGFRADAQAIRLALAEAGVPTNFATPRGAKRAVYDEHHATWVLPTVVGIMGSGVLGIATPFIVDWIRSRFASISEKDRSQVKLQYREAELNLETGQLHMYEIEGDPEGVAAAIQQWVPTA
jgi:hypothetical protein